ncbi:hypothetical protein HanIR_Chr07g0303061 [Helianthus annuus]|nr:hypothetical protein HanIR_Chr07g0303061 [Helianthus annuus]
MRAQVYTTHARMRHVTGEPIRSRHTVVPYWLTLVRHARHISVHAPQRADQAGHPPCTCAPACHVIRQGLPATWSLQPLCVTTHVVKNTKRLATLRACEVQSASSKRHIAPIAHATRVRVLCTFRKYTSVCFHETKCSHLNTFLSFISSYVGQCATFPLFRHSICGTMCHFLIISAFNVSNTKL